MTDKEKIRVEIERRLKGLSDGCVGQRFAYQTLLSFIDSLQEEPVSEELEEEIDAWCQNVITGLPIVKEAARHFADWQKQQMMKDAVHAIVDSPFRMEFPNIYPDYRELKDYCDKNGIKDDDKVKLIIIKED